VSLIDSFIDKSDIAHGLLLSCLETLALLPPQLFEISPSIRGLIAKVRSHLNSSNPNLQLLAARCLKSLPLSLWMNGDRKHDTWEKEWKQIMRGLESRDDLIRKTVSHLLRNYFDEHQLKICRTFSINSSSLSSIISILV
jgi:hypothetical protein